MIKRGLIRRLTLFSTTVALALGLLHQSIPQAYADRVWDAWQAAESAVRAGNMPEATRQWTWLVDHYASIGDWENAALFSGKLNEYYDSVQDYERAIRYYELENEYWVKDGKDWGAVDLMRAEQIRTVVDVYRSAPLAAHESDYAAGQGGLAKFEPRAGAYIGLYSEQDPGMQNYYTRSQSIYGKDHAIYLAYTQWGKPFPNQHAARAKEAGAALQIGWEPMGGLDEVRDGDYLRQWARDAKAAGIPIFLRYACEMNGNWTPWSGDPARYIEKFRLVHDVLEAEAPNVAMVWSPNDVPRYSMEPYYPGDEYVDWVGISLYTEPYENGDPSLPMFGTSPVERLDELYRLYADRKPIMISETAVSHYSHQAGEDVTDWALMNLHRLYEVMPKKYPRLKAITYFNVNLEGRESDNNYLLRDNEAMLAAYKSIISSPYFLSRVERGAAPGDENVYVALDEADTFRKGTRLVPFVKIPEIHIGRIEYVLDGRLLASQERAPYSLDVEAGEVSGDSVLTLRVYNRSGELSAEASFPFRAEVTVALNGRELSFEQAPVIAGGSTLTPLRAIFEALGARVTWDADTRTATGVKGGTTVELTIGSGTARVNGLPVELEQPAALVGGYTMAPARFVGEAFGGKVAWEGATRTVLITP